MSRQVWYFFRQVIISIVWMVLAFVIGIAVGCAAANAVTNPDYYYYYTTY